MHPGPISRTNQASLTGGGGARGPGGWRGARNRRHNRTPRSPSLATHVGPAYYKLLPVTLSFNSPDPLPLSPLSRLLRFSSRRRREAQWISRRL
jgi:hypothetical protein